MHCTARVICTMALCLGFTAPIFADGSGNSGCPDGTACGKGAGLTTAPEKVMAVRGQPEEAGADTPASKPKVPSGKPNKAKKKILKRACDDRCN